MSELSQADQYLIEQIRRGSEEGWQQIVQRYQGRMLAFARSQLRDRAEAEDLVQETFLGFLKSVEKFETRASLETYLFMILRRRLVDWFRRCGRNDEVTVCSLQRHGASSADESTAGFEAFVDRREATASRHLEQNEERQIQEEMLWQALRGSIERLQREMKFRDLQIFEMVFYAQLRNKEIALRLGMDEKQVALVKHRFIKRLAEAISPATGTADYLPDESLLTRLWEEHRPSCPKRSTVGKLLLGTLDDEWRNYVNFHLQMLGCRTCQANLDDLRSETVDRPSKDFCDRILQSSVGFFRH
jgi:RNA polymerase sigma factor (sigma-70 family)